MLYTQLLYPALVDAGLPGAAIDAELRAGGTQLTAAVVRRLHASAPGGTVVHLHDLLAFGPGHPQPFGLDEVLELAVSDPARALELADTGDVPLGADPRATIRAGGAELRQTQLWEWLFAPGVSYLVAAFVTAVPPGSAPDLHPAPTHTRPTST